MGNPFNFGRFRSFSLFEALPLHDLQAYLLNAFADVEWSKHLAQTHGQATALDGHGEFVIGQVILSLLFGFLLVHRGPNLVVLGKKFVKGLLWWNHSRGVARAANLLHLLCAGSVLLIELLSVLAIRQSCFMGA